MSLSRPVNIHFLYFLLESVQKLIYAILIYDPQLPPFGSRKYQTCHSMALHQHHGIFSSLQIIFLKISILYSCYHWTLYNRNFPSPSNIPIEQIAGFGSSNTLILSLYKDLQIFQYQILQHLFSI